MLALATTTATVTGRAAGTLEHDAHGSPLPAPGEAGPALPAHRSPGVTVPGEDGTEVRGCRWSLDPATWPVRVGDVVADVQDGTRWTVVAAQLVPSGLGLEQVQADCSQVAVSR